jgi:hypothetical protein
MAVADGATPSSEGAKQESAMEELDRTEAYWANHHTETGSDA